VFNEAVVFLVDVFHACCYEAFWQRVILTEVKEYEI